MLHAIEIKHAVHRGIDALGDAARDRAFLIAVHTTLLS